MMIRILYIVLHLGLLMVCTNCSKDIGNYDYQDKNVLTVDSILTEDHNSGRIYRFVYGDSINIVPVITGTMSKNDLSGLSFVWTVGKDTIAKTKDLRITSDRIGFGKKVGNLYITDHTEDVRYNFNFTFEITSDAPRGHFVLAEDAQGRSLLYTKSSVKPSASFKSYDKIGNFSLGDKPSGLELVRNSGSSSTNYTYSLITATEKGAPYQVMQCLVGDMLPTILYGNNSLSGSEKIFAPTSLKRTRSFGRVSYVLNNGKIHTVSMGVVSPVLYPEDPLGYDFGKEGLIANVGLFGYYVAGFD